MRLVKVPYLLQLSKTNSNLNESNVIGIGPKVKVRVPDDESALLSIGWRLNFLENNSLNGGGPFHDVISEGFVSFDANLDVGKSLVRFEGLGNNETSMFKGSEPDGRM